MKIPLDISKSLLNKIVKIDAAKLFQSLPDNSIDLIFTDPPYPRVFFHCYEILAHHAPRVMKHGASLVTIIPHYNLPKVLELFGRNLKWRWLLEMDQTDGTHSRMAMGIEVLHKPMGWWVKGSYPSGRGFLRDQVKISKPDKRLHAWQQNIDWCSYYIERLAPGQKAVVLDPFVGAGTVPEACIRLGKYFIAGDIAPEAVMITKKRLNAMNK